MEKANNKFDLDSLKFCLSKSQQYGFLSPQPIENQINHALDFLSLFEDHYESAIDLGSGGGLPSLVWLYKNSSIVIYALDAMKKRTNFLESLKIDFPSISQRLIVINGRAEELAHQLEYREKFTLVVARGFGPPSTTAECASGFLQDNGRLIVSGRPEQEALRWNEKKLSKVGLRFDKVLNGSVSHAASMTKVSTLSSAYPRTAKLLKSEPLW